MPRRSSRLRVVHSGHFGERRLSLTAGALGMLLFLVSLAMLFGGTIVATLWARAHAPVWQPNGAPALPSTLWLSTALVLVVSGAIQTALIAARRNRQHTLQRALGTAWGCALAFLVSQALSWAELLSAHVSRSLYAFSFYMLTSLHAAHVVGGVLSLGFVWLHARRGRYTPVYHRGVAYQAMYWHFLGGVWMVLFALLSLLS